MYIFKSIQWAGMQWICIWEACGIWQRIFLDITFQATSPIFWNYFNHGSDKAVTPGDNHMSFETN